MIWYSHLFKNFPVCCDHTVKAFGIVNKAEVDAFLEFFCFFYDTTDVGSLLSGSYAFSNSILNIWKFSVHVLLKPSLENFEIREFQIRYHKLTQYEPKWCHSNR